MKVYSFVYANGNLNNFSGDIKAFYTYLTNSQAFPASSQYLLGMYISSTILIETMAYLWFSIFVFENVLVGDGLIFLV